MEQKKDKTEEKIILTPKNDIIFQTIFSKKHKNLTKNLIESIIKEKIEDIEIDVATHLVKNYATDKLGILDLRVKFKDGSQCSIEVQLINHGNMIDRITYYMASQYASQIEEGGEYGEIKRTICIGILGFEVRELKGMEEYSTRWRIIEDKYRKKVLTEKMEIYIIELKKLRKKEKKELEDRQTQWMLFLDNPRSEEVKEIMGKSKEIKEAVETYEKVTQNKDLRRLAELREKAIRDEISLRKYERREGMRVGLEKGLEKGLREGMREGENKGKKERELEIVKRLKNMGLTIEQIEEATELDRKVIEKI